MVHFETGDSIAVDCDRSEERKDDFALVFLLCFFSPRALDSSFHEPYNRCPGRGAAGGVETQLRSIGLPVNVSRSVLKKLPRRNRWQSSIFGVWFRPMILQALLSLSSFQPVCFSPGAFANFFQKDLGFDGLALSSSFDRKR